MQHTRSITLLTLHMLLCVSAYCQQIRFDSAMSDFVVTPFSRNGIAGAANRQECSHAAQLANRNASVCTETDEECNLYVFNPCATDLVNELEALSCDELHSNFGFEEGNLNNWIVFMGSNRYMDYDPFLYAAVPYQAHFRVCDFYHPSSLMLCTSVPPGWGHDDEELRIRKNFDARVEVVSHDCEFPMAAKDPVGDYPTVALLADGSCDPNNVHSLRLGKNELYEGHLWYGLDRNPAEMAVRKVKVKRSSPYITYKYALSLSNYWDHPEGWGAYFKVQLFDHENECHEVPCAGYFVNAQQEDNPGLNINPNHSANWGVGNKLGGVVKGDSKYKVWTTNTIDLTSYFPEESPEIEEKIFVIAFTASNCKGNADYGYAFIDMECASGIMKGSGIPCTSSTCSFSGPTGNYPEETYEWKVYRNEGGTLEPQDMGTTVNNEALFEFLFTSSGDYVIELVLTHPSQGGPDDPDACEKHFRYDLHVDDDCSAQQIICDDCITSFAPLPDHKYVLSAWVKQDDIPAEGAQTYGDPQITIIFDISGGSPVTLPAFAASGPIIDGWQKIETEFTTPEDATHIHIKLENLNATPGKNVYFDDIRVFPFDGNMKSFVYDPISQKLMAELDENNFATYYEYDEEGKLRRVKKETERGVMTLKESGNHNSKR